MPSPLTGQRVSLRNPFLAVQQTACQNKRSQSLRRRSVGFHWSKRKKEQNISNPSLSFLKYEEPVRPPGRMRTIRSTEVRQERMRNPQTNPSGISIMKRKKNPIRPATLLIFLPLLFFCLVGSLPAAGQKSKENQSIAKESATSAKDSRRNTEALILLNGTRIPGLVTQTGNTYFVHTNHGILAYSREQVARVEL